MVALATVKLRVCKSLTLSSSLSKDTVPLLMKTVNASLRSVVPAAYHALVPVVVNNAVRAGILFLALVQHRLLSTYHSAIRGGLLISRGLLSYLNAMRIVTLKEEDTLIDEITGYGLAYLGLLAQARHDFQLSFPLNVVLLPFSLVEAYLVNNIK